MVDSSVSIEELSASLVREYLARKGLRGTLAKLDDELPRTSESISNRSSLAKAVHIEKLMKKNKEDAAPYRTMIEVIVKSLTTSANRKTLSTTHVATVAKISSPKEGVANSTSREMDEPPVPYKTSDSAIPIHAGHEKKTTVLGDVDPQIMSADRTETLSRDGNPITKLLTSNPNSHGPHTSATASHHLGKKLTYPKAEPSLLEESTVHGSTVEPRRHAASPKQKDMATLVSLKPQGDLSSRRGRVGSGVTCVASGSVAGPRPTSIAHSPGSRVLKSEHRSPATKEQPHACTLMPDNNAGSAKVKHYEEGSSRHTCAVSHRNKGVTIRKDNPTRPLLSVGSHAAGNLHKSQQGSFSDPSSEDLLCEDLEDVDVGASISSIPTLSRAMKPPCSKGQLIDLTTSKALRELVFGTAVAPSFNAEWRRQNFEFCNIPKLEYGLVQHKGGPCGVLAGVQAYVLKHLMFVGSKSELSSSPQPTDEERTGALTAALADILWKAGQQKSATIAITTRNNIVQMSDKKRALPSRTHYKPDNITENLMLHTFASFGTLHDCLKTQLPILQDSSSSGCICFLYSLLLSRGIENVKADMDSDTTLLGAHGYCTQELVNLILTGYAVSNTFNDTKELDTGKNNKVILRGIPGPSELGLLSLFEHYQTCTVGSNLKDPEYPIWVVYSESHFTVLFSHQRNLLQNSQLQKKFDLHYYDELAHQDEPIVLTIDNSGLNREQLVCDSDLVPPLELVIKTKWKSANIDWNSTEPLL